MLRWLYVASVFTLCMSAAPASADQRIALVIGNQAYSEKVGPLRNPHHDIALVGNALNELGFKVLNPRKDATRDDILFAVHELANELRAAGGGAVSFLYYAGHGVAVGSENVLIPLNVEDTSDAMLSVRGVRLSEILDILTAKAPAAVHFVVLDACRNIRGQRGDRGFAPVNDQRSGVVLAFSTAAGKTATDEGATSTPYAAALASEIVKPGRNDHEVFNAVRTRVVTATRDRTPPQTPWVNDGLVGQRVVFKQAIEEDRRDLGQAPSSVTMTFSAVSEPITSVAFSLDGSRVLAGSSDRSVTLWDATSGTLLRRFDGHDGKVTSTAFSPDGKLILSASEDKSTRLWEVSTGKLIRTVKEHEAPITSVAFSPDGTRALLGSSDKDPSLWDLSTGQRIRIFKGHDKPVTSVAFSPDGVHVLSGSHDRTLRLWEADTGRLLREFRGHWNPVLSLAYSPDGLRLLSGGADGTVKLWDAPTARLMRTFDGHKGEVTGVGFSRDGLRVISASLDKTLVLWNALDGRSIRSFVGHQAPVTSLALSPDGARLLSGSADGTTRLWDAATGGVLVDMRVSPTGEWLSNTPAGFFAASKAGAQMLTLVRRLEVFSADQLVDHLYRPDLVHDLLQGDPESKHQQAAHFLNLERLLGSGLPPIVGLVHDRTERSDDVLKLTSRIVDTGGGIGRKVIWKVNGLTQVVTDGASARDGLTTIGDPVLVQQTLRVDPARKNEIEIIAFNREGLLSTVPIRITFDALGVAERRRPRLFVLAVGVDKYAKREWQLQYAAKDARAVASALKAVGNTMYSEVQVMTLLDAEATERGIVAAFDRLSSTIGPGDAFILYLTGQGRSIAGRWFFLPQDLNLSAGHTIENRGIGQDKWQAWISKIAASKVLVVVDVCEAGNTPAVGQHPAILVDRDRQTAIEQLRRATGYNIITASAAGQACYEGYQGHGMLTYAVLEGLHRSEGDLGEIASVFGLAEHVNRQLPAITERWVGVRQHPQSLLSGDFPLGMRQPVLKSARPGPSGTP